MIFDKIKNLGLIMLAFFPITDYVLRKIPVLGSVWDELLLLALGTLALFRYLTGKKVEFLPYHKVLTAFIFLGLAFVAIGLPSFFIELEGFRAVYTYSLFAFILPFLVDKNTAGKLIRYALYAGLIISLHGVYQYIVKTPIPEMWVDPGESVRTRVFSIFGSPNIMGSYMLLIFPTAAGMAVTTKSKSGRLIFAVIAAASLASLLFTFTRGAWLALFGAVAITAVLFDKRLLFLASAGAIAAMFVPQIQSRFGQLFDPIYWQKAAQDGRIYRWLLAYDTMRENPFFGAGIGHYGGAVAARHLGVLYVDNYYAKTMAEMGLVGLTAMLTLYGTVVKNLHQRIFKPLRTHKEWPLLLGLFTSILAILLQNGVENVFEVPAMNFLFWFYVSMAAILTYSDTEVKA